MPKANIFGLSIDGPGKRTADPVPDEITRNPPFLQSLTSESACDDMCMNRHTAVHCVLP